jgi:hypothetical protein
MSNINTESNICIKRDNGDCMNVYCEITKIVDDIKNAYIDMSDPQCIMMSDLIIESPEERTNIYDEIRRIQHIIKEIQNNIDDDRKRSVIPQYNGRIHISGDIEFGTPQIKLQETLVKLRDDAQKLHYAYQQFHAKQI